MKKSITNSTQNPLPVIPAEAGHEGLLWRICMFGDFAGFLRNISYFSLVFFCLISFSLVAQPVITHIEPPAAIPGSTVTLHGFNFEITPANNTVTFAGVSATVASATATKLIVTVPAATAGPGDVIITNANGTSQAFTFTVLSAPSPGVFGNQNTITAAANGAYSVYAADLDGDGDMDVLSASANDDKIAWYKNNGAGGFTAQTFITTTANGANSVYAADLDGDGDMDVLSSSWYDDKIAWYQNNGAGVFTAQSAISTTANGAISVHAADLDSDGDMDVLSSSVYDNKIAWYQNNGAGVFTSQPAISTTANGVYSVYAADLDGDGDMDVLSSSSSDDKIVWYKNNGTGAFTAQPDITNTVDGAYSVYAADLDGDGDVDVLSASVNDDKIAWYKNNGTGVFTAQPIISNTADGASSVYAVDLDGDGDMDVLSASRVDNKIAWYQNNGAGVFTSQPAISTTANGVESVYTADLDGDGDMDVLSASQNDNKIASYANHFSKISRIEPISAVQGSTVKIYGNNMDPTIINVNFGSTSAMIDIAKSTSSVLEVSVPNITPGLVDVVLVSPNGYSAAQEKTNFTVLSSFPPDTVITQSDITTNADGASSVYAADLDGDGDMDVLSASQYDNKIAWYQNDGTGVFTVQTSITETADGATTVYAADLDGDGDIDVLSASYNDDKIAWYKNDGAGGFASQPDISIGANGATSVYVADLNGDGDMDVLSASRLDNKIAWYKNDGTGGFTSQPDISIGANGAWSVYAADLDGDGDMDVLSASLDGDMVSWYENMDGTGSFGVQQDITTTANKAISVYAADLDGDGDLDVLFASYLDNKIAWYENNGAGVFTIPTTITTSASNVYSVYAADMDGDGDMDVLSASSNDDKIAWYENTDGLGSFGTQQNITITADEAYSVYAADLDGDGDLDVLSASANDDKIAWYKRSFTGNDILTFTIAEETGAATSDNINFTILIEVANGTDLTAISPGAGLSPGASVAISSTDYSGAVTYTVTSEVGVSQDWLVNVIPVTDAPVLSLTTAEQTTAGFSWNQPAYTQGYKLEVSTDATFSGFITGYPKSIANAATLSESLTGLTAGNNYYVRIRSYNQFNTESVNSSTLNILTKPETLVLNDATTINQTSFTIDWAASAGMVDDYLLEVSSTDFASPTLLTGYPLTITGTSLNIGVDAGTTPLIPGTNYWVRVRSRNSSGESPNSNVQAALTKPATPVLNAIAPTDIGQTTTSLSWATVSGVVDNYRMDVSDDGFQTFLSGYNNLTVTDVAIDITGLDPGTPYEARTRAINASGESPNSSVISFLTIPANPTATSAAAIIANAFQATWNAVAGADYYILQVSADDFVTIILQDTVTNELFADVTGLSAGTTYTYRVQSGNVSGVSGYSNVVAVTTSANEAPLSLALSYADKFSNDQASSIITISTSGGAGNQTLVIRTKNILALSYGSDQTLTTNSDGEYGFTVTSAMLDEMGFEFEVEVTDISNNTDKKTGMILRSFNEAGSPAIPFEQFGGTDNTWNLFSIPYELDNKSISTVFADYDPARHEYDWKIVRYRNSSNDYVNFNTGQVKAGEAYWFNAKEKISVKTGAGKVVSLIPFPMSLVKGWNLIGNPYPVNISWQQVILDNPTVTGVESLQIFKNRSQSTGNIMVPFSGGFVWSDQAASVIINPQTANIGGRISSATKKITGNDIDGQEWMLDINLITNDKEEKLGGFGMHPGASMLKDRFDAMAVPRFMVYTDLFTEHQDYFYPWFATDIVPTAASHTWTFTLASNELTLARLKWNQTVLQGKGAKLYLLDKTSGKLIDLKLEGSHVVDLSKGDFKFDIFFVANDGPLLPNDLVLGSAYPNPALTQTAIPVVLPVGLGDKNLTLSIYDINGKHVATLADGVYATGFYEFIWNIEKAESKNGLFIYRLVFNDGSFPPIQKKLIVR